MTKKIVFNALGFIAGYVAVAIAYSVARWLFIDVLGSIGIIRNLLSWPVDYTTYAISGILLVENFAGMFTCSAITKIGKSQYNYSCILLGVVRIIVWIATVIETWAEFGFSFDLLCMAFTAVVFYIISISCFYKNEEVQ